MSFDLTVARPYAEALFELACASGCLSLWDNALSDLVCIESDEAFRAFIADPRNNVHMSRRLIRDVLVAIAPEWLNQLDAQLDNFVALLLEEKRFPVMAAIADIFHKKWVDHEGRKEAYVTVAIDWPSEKKQALLAALQKRLNAEVVCRFEVDPDIKGGAVIRVDHWVFDGSVRSKLSRLRESLETMG